MLLVQGKLRGFFMQSLPPKLIFWPASPAVSKTHRVVPICVPPKKFQCMTSLHFFNLTWWIGNKLMQKCCRNGTTFWPFMFAAVPTLSSTHTRGCTFLPLTTLVSCSFIFQSLFFFFFFFLFFGGRGGVLKLQLKLPGMWTLPMLIDRHTLREKQDCWLMTGICRLCLATE